MASLVLEKNIKKIFENKKIKILIWGFGKTGRSLLKYFSSNFEHKLYVCDKKKIEFEARCSYPFEFVNEEYFLLNHVDYDLIIPSPGIKLPSGLRFCKRIATELDLFFCLFKGEIIAITGSVGKTSVTTFIYEILKNNKKKNVYVGGNIGMPAFDILSDGNVNGTAVLEVSDAQLQYTKIFSPDYFLWTNTYKNHLDRHSSFFWYFWAKLRPFYNSFEKIKLAFVDFKTNKIILNKKKFNFDKRKIVVYDDFTLEDEFLPKCSYLNNWLLVSNFLNHYGLDYKEILKKLSFDFNIKIPEHRLEYCGTSKEKVDFYNDSKSTIIESTLAAIGHFKKTFPSKEITLIFGGLSKGVDRSNGIFIASKEVKNAVFFGKEAEMYREKCSKFINNLVFFEDLNGAFDYAKVISKENGAVLFSPGGSSFDLFSSYGDRGERFKALVKKNI